MRFLSQIFRIKEGEGNRVFLFFLCFFFLISSFVVGKTVRDTFFLSRFDPAYLPHMFIVSAVSIAATIAVYTRMARRFSLVPMALFTFSVGAGSFLVIQMSLTRWLYPFLYVWVDVIGTVTMIQFWLLANSAFTTREAKRLFSVIGSGGALAGTITGFSIRPFVTAYGTGYLLIFTALLMGLSLVMVIAMRPFVAAESPSGSRFIPGPARERKKKPSRKALRSSYLKTIALTVTISAIVASIVDYQLKIIASQHLDESGMASLFGVLYGLIGVVSVIMQFLVTGRILSRFGIFWGLLFLPAGLFTGNLLLLLYPMVTSAVLAKAGDQIFRFTIHDTTQQLLWLPVPSHQKNRAKPFIDGSVKNGAQGISGLLILAMVYFFDVRYLSIPALLLIILWTMSNLRLKKEYILELGKAIEKRRLDFESLEIDITDPSIVNTLKDALMKGDDSQKLFALDTLKNLPLSPWIPHLRQLFQSGSPLIVRQVADLARSDTRIVSDDDIITLTKTRDDAVAAEAMIICGERKLTKAVDRLRMELRTENPRRRSAAAAGILLMGSDTDGQAERALHSMLFDPHNETQIAALKSTGRLPHLVTDEGLATLLADDSPDVRRLAADLAAERTNPALIEPLVENLRNATTALNVRRALTSYDPGSVLSTLLRRLGNGRAQDDLAVGIIRCLGDYPRLSAVNALIERLDDSPSPVAREITDTLLKMARKNPLSDDQSHRLDGILGNVIRRLYSHLDLLHRFQKEDPDFLLEDLILTMIQREQTEILKLSLVPFPHSPVETLHHTLMSGSPRARANGLEILDNLLPRETREKILPLFDDSPLEEKIKMGQHLYPTAAVPEETALVGWLQSASRWTSAVALRYILTYDRLEAVLTAPGAGAINWNQLSRSNLNREVVSAAWDGNGSALQQLPDFPKQRFLLEEMPMYSTLEKTIFMKGVDLFQDIPGEEVSHAAQIAQEVQLPSEEPIFHEGDPGDSMFIIVAGKVRIHKSGRSAEGQREIAVLSKGEFMGEMALLDQEPRSASATTLEDTVLLRISGEDFYDLMASRVDIMHGIVRVLTKRLRGAIS